MARHGQNIRHFTIPISWDPADDVAEYAWCSKCCVQGFVLNRIDHSQLQALLDPKLGETNWKWLPKNKKYQKVERLTARLNQNGSLTFARIHDDFPGLDREATFGPRELGLDPTYEFEVSAARWLGLAEL